MCIAVVEEQHGFLSSWILVFVANPSKRRQQKQSRKVWISWSPRSDTRTIIG